MYFETSSFNYVYNHLCLQTYMKLEVVKCTEFIDSHLFVQLVVWKYIYDSFPYNKFAELIFIKINIYKNQN